MKKYYSQVAKKIEPYSWEFGDGIRFNSNTLPFPPPSLGRFLRAMKKGCSINEYGDPNYTDLKILLADYEKVSVDNLTIINSGDEAIDVIAKTFLDSGDLFITTPPTYEMFAIQSEINKGRNIEVPLKESRLFLEDSSLIAQNDRNWIVNADEIIRQANKRKVKLIFLCNPNNPTGSIISEKIIEKIVKDSDAIIVIDETYREFYGESSVNLIKKYDNVVVLRSFSKFAGIAGARIGYLIANKRLSKKFNFIRFPMGVSYFSYKLAEFVLKNDQKWIQDQVTIIQKERERLAKVFINFGWKVYPSQTNFLLVKVGKNAKDLCLQLQRKGILVRDRSSKKYLENCIRVTVRSPKENDRLIKELEIAARTMFARNDETLRDDVGKKVAFLDRDGTLLFEPQDTFQIDSLEKLKILDGVIDGLKYLIQRGFSLVLVTNQDGLGTKSFPKKTFQKPQNLFLKILKENGIKFEEIFICPHVITENCNCRKPNIGLIKNFLIKNTIDRKKSFVCGDRKTDKKFAENIGLTFIAMQTNGNFYNALKKGGIL